MQQLNPEDVKSEDVEEIKNTVYKEYVSETNPIIHFNRECMEFEN